MSTNAHIEIYTDGSWSNGVGGWACVVPTTGEVIGGYRTSAARGSYQMEIEAIIKAVAYAKAEGFNSVRVRSDCRGAIKLLQAGKKAQRGYAYRIGCKHTRNLMVRWAEVSADIDISLKWVKAHVGIEANEAADRQANHQRKLAMAQIERQELVPA